jgi:hypothetical protein
MKRKNDLSNGDQCLHSIERFVFCNKLAHGNGSNSSINKPYGLRKTPTDKWGVLYVFGVKGIFRNSEAWA